TDYLKEKVTNKGMVRSYSSFGVTATDEYYYTDRSISRLSLEGKIGKAKWQMLNGFAYYKRTRNTYSKDLTTLAQDLSTDPGVQDTSKFNDITSRGIYSNKFKLFELTAGYDMTIQQAF